jgi:K+-sensing histidine kinase KdpD
MNYLRPAFRTAEGAVISVLIAAIVARVFAQSLLAVVVPFAFAGILILLSWRFGALVSVVGSLMGVLIFADFLYAPRGFHVENDVARANLAWMVLLSVAGSYLLFPPRMSSRR